MAQAPDVPTAAPQTPDADLMRRMFEQMWLIRRFEERAAEEYMRGKIGGFLHLSIGEEAAIVGTIAALANDDPITTTYREHGHALARGSEPKRVMAELFGRASGLCGGRGGSMHLMDLERSFYGGYAIVGGSIPLAVGLGWAIVYRDEPRVALTMFGDGAANQGVLAESLNMAALWGLPVVFVVLNNQYGMGTPVSRAASDPDLFERAEAFGIESHRVDGMDVMATHAAMAEAVHAARHGRRPRMVELSAYRYRGHSMSDPDTVRDRAERDRWQERDPVVTFKRVLLGEGVLNREDVAALEARVDQTIEEAVAFADASPEVDPAELALHAYSQPWTGDPRGSALMPGEEAGR